MAGSPLELLGQLVSLAAGRAQREGELGPGPVRCSVMAGADFEGAGTLLGSPPHRVDFHADHVVLVLGPDRDAARPARQERFLELDRMSGTFCRSGVSCSFGTSIPGLRPAN